MKFSYTTAAEYAELIVLSIVIRRKRVWNEKLSAGFIDGYSSTCCINATCRVRNGYTIYRCDRRRCNYGGTCCAVQCRGRRPGIISVAGCNERSISSDEYCSIVRNKRA